MNFSGSLKSKSGAISIVGTYLVFFLLGLVYLRLNYTHFFHADTAGLMAAGQALNQSVSLFLSDNFYYGNQLLIWRSGQGIAIALALGLKGGAAFVGGMALSYALWGTFLYFVLTLVFEKKKALLLALCLLFPIGSFDLDYMIGQQSHLSNAVLCFSSALLLYLAHCRQGQSRQHLIFGLILLFFVGLEAPLRAYLAGIPIAMVLFMTYHRQSIKAIIGIAGSLIAGYLVNKFLLEFYPIQYSHTADRTMGRWAELMGSVWPRFMEILTSVTGFDYLDNRSLSVAGLIFAGFAFLFVGLLVVQFFRGCTSAVVALINVAGKKPEEQSLETYVLRVGAVGFAVNFLAVAFINPDSSRHLLWTVFTLKFCVFISVWRFVESCGLKKSCAAVAILVLTIVPSVFTSSLANWGTGAFKKSVPYHVRVIEDLANKIGVRHIEGADFWSTMTMSVWIKDATTGVVHNTKELPSMHWLSLKRYPEGETLYYVRSQDNYLRAKVKESQGQLLYRDQNFEVWRSAVRLHR